MRWMDSRVIGNENPLGKSIEPDVVSIWVASQLKTSYGVPVHDNFRMELNPSLVIVSICSLFKLHITSNRIRRPSWIVNPYKKIVRKTWWDKHQEWMQDTEHGGSNTCILGPPCKQKYVTKKILLMKCVPHFLSKVAVHVSCHKIHPPKHKQKNKKRMNHIMLQLPNSWSGAKRPVCTGNRPSLSWSIPFNTVWKALSYNF